MIVGSEPPICHLYGLINSRVRGKEQRRWGNESDCYVSRCLWLAKAKAKDLLRSTAILEQIPAGLLPGSYDKAELKTI